MEFQLNKRDKTLLLFAVLSLGLGIILHFSYEYSEYNNFIGYFSAVNESIWEHTKLTVIPLTIFLGIFLFKFGKEINNPFFAYGLSITLSTVIVPTLFYTYQAITGSHSFVFDMVIFVLAILIPLVCFRWLISMSQLPASFEVVGIFLIVIVLTCEIYFTYHPLDYLLFKS